MLTPGGFALGACLSLAAGLDRTAALQLMLSRPLVAATATGLLLGAPWLGLEIGAILELLWISRMPVGAAIPPDDTQIAVGGTVLAVSLSPELALAPSLLAPLVLLAAMPLGKLGQYFERLARNGNDRLMDEARHGTADQVERLHLRGLGHFALASLTTFAVVVAGGSAILSILGPLLLPSVTTAAPWLRLLFIFVGSAVLLRTLHVGRALPLFIISFLLGMLTLWLIRS